MVECERKESRNFSTTQSMVFLQSEYYLVFTTGKVISNDDTSESNSGFVPCRLKSYDNHSVISSTMLITLLFSDNTRFRIDSDDMKIIP
jgi:hypothetical protein